MFRNREIRIEWIIDVAATALLAAAGFFVHPLCGVLLLVLGAGLTALHLYLGRRRYRVIAKLSERIDDVLHAAVPEPIEESDEGELAILSDEIRKMTVRLREQNDRLLADKRLLSDAIADLFHQMRTPLTAMNLTVTLLADETLPQEKRIRYLHELKQQLARMQWMTETLLKLSKLDANTVRFAPETLSVQTLIEQAAEPLLIPMELKELTYTADCGEAMLTADRAWTEAKAGTCTELTCTAFLTATRQRALWCVRWRSERGSIRTRSRKGWSSRERRLARCSSRPWDGRGC